MQRIEKGQALSDVAIEGITGGVDTAAYVQESSSVSHLQEFHMRLLHLQKLRVNA